MNPNDTSPRSLRQTAYAAVTVLGYVLAVTFLLLWKGGTNQEWDMGSVPAWISAIATTLALFGVGIAAWHLRGAQRDSHAREERERLAQASRVYWRVEHEMSERSAGSRIRGVRHFVVNASDEPIRNVCYVAVEVEGTRAIKKICSKVLVPGEEAFGALFDYTDLPAGFGGVRTSVPIPNVETTRDQKWDVAVIFSDSAARSWIRLPDLILKDIPGHLQLDPAVELVRQWRKHNDARQADRKSSRLRGLRPKR
ncbi:hypothetical protein BH23ACT6_BH23ACT6_25000 [soil metagenome]